MTEGTPKTYLQKASEEFERRYSELRLSQDASARSYGIPGEDHSYVAGPYLISRPYNLDRATIAQLLRFAEENELEFNIEGASTWHPWTITVRMWKGSWLAEFDDGAESRGSEFKKEVSEILSREVNPKVYSVARAQRVHEESGVYVIDTRGSKEGTGRSVDSGDALDVVQPNAGYTLN